MYHIVDATRKIDSEKNEIAIMNVFEEFIGCAVSSLIAGLTCTFRVIYTSPKQYWPFF
jgi:hypothetical protein